jgi:hypothetical protein
MALLAAAGRTAVAPAAPTAMMAPKAARRVVASGKVRAFARTVVLGICFSPVRVGPGKARRNLRDVPSRDMKNIERPSLVNIKNISSSN